METAGAETLSVFPSEIPPGAVGLSAAEEVRGVSGGVGWMLCPGVPARASPEGPVSPSGRDGSCRVHSRVWGRIMVGKASAIKPQALVGKGNHHEVPLRVRSAFTPPIPTASPWLRTRRFPAAQPVPALGSRLCPSCCPVLLTSVLEFHQKALNRQKNKGPEGCRGCGAGGPRSGRGWAANAVGAGFQGDAGCRVILSWVMARTDVFRSVDKETALAFRFVLLSRFDCSLAQVLFSPEERGLEGTGSTGTAEV